MRWQHAGTHRRLWDVPVPMRDGVALAADVFLPPCADEGQPAPALLMRTPYGKQSAAFKADAARYAGQGYAVVLQDVRGRHESGGAWEPFRNEGPDGYDAIEWIASQEWCTGKVGTYGASYGGWVQWAAARERPPHLAALVSRAAGGRWMQEIPYDNGMLVLAMMGWLNLASGRTMKDGSQVDWRRVLHHLPLRTMDGALGRTLPAWQEFLDHPRLDGYWQALRLTDEDFAAIDVPGLHITGWYDEDQPGALFFYEEMIRSSPARDRQAIRIGPWSHGGTGAPTRELRGVDFTDAAVVDVQALHLDWFDRWLKDEEASSGGAPRAHYFLTGINEWREGAAWPPEPSEELLLYLASQGSANTLDGDGVLDVRPSATSARDELRYDPRDPITTTEDFDYYAESAEPPLDVRRVGGRDDVLVYTGTPVATALTATGRPWLHLFGSSDCPDTDWVVSLEDVHPDGTSLQLAKGRIRARFRESLDEERLLVPGEVYEFRIELSSVGHVFLPGHRIRVTITHSDFPTYDRNPNTGHPIGEDAELRVALNSVHHGEATPSRLVLPRPSSPP
jgi:uncharacterized protein